MVDKLDKQAHFKEKDLIDRYESALWRAAEQFYKSEMEDTNMAVLEIKEVAEKYPLYRNEQDKKEAIENCAWETKRQWMETLIDLWMNPQE
jgi:hypothetical protein